MTDSQQLLAEYVRTGSEPAFRELVSRYINLVYSVALRLTCEDSHLAQDVTQMVFADLARKARKLSDESMLGGWLHRHTCFVTSNVRRSEQRRQLRERQAVEMNSIEDHSQENLARVTPVLDEAINELAAEDRSAILLRFFEQRDFRSIGQALGSNEDAAQKRVSRALEKLQLLLKERGVAFSTAALGTLLTSSAVNAAPVGLVATVSGLAVAGATQAGGIISLLQFTAMTKLKTSIVGAIVAGGVAASFVVHHQAQGKLRELNQSSGQRMEQMNALRSENAELSQRLQGAGDSEVQLKDLERLRREAAALRDQSSDLEKLRSEVSERQRPEPAAPPKTEQQIREENMMAMSKSKGWLIAFHMYANKNKGAFPGNYGRAESFLRESEKESALSITNRFDVVYEGPLSALTNASHTIVLRDKQATQLPNGSWQKMYGYADGHMDVRTQTDFDFSAYEEQRIVPTSNP
jgi:RNA polymerase sigma factor (sigma-70 family)